MIGFRKRGNKILSLKVKMSIFFVDSSLEAIAQKALFKCTFSNSLIIHAALTQPQHLNLVRWNELKTRPCLKRFQTRKPIFLSLHIDKAIPIKCFVSHRPSSREGRSVGRAKKKE